VVSSMSASDNFAVYDPLMNMSDGQSCSIAKSLLDGKVLE
jgi:hypothetical protein